MMMNTTANPTANPTTEPINEPALSNFLLEDLLNPSISALDLCNHHNLSLPQLSAIINSEQFALAKQTIEEISRARRELMQPEAQTLALARLTDLCKDKPETPQHAETVRKAASKIISTERGHSCHPLHTQRRKEPQDRNANTQKQTCWEQTDQVQCSQNSRKVTKAAPGLIPMAYTPHTRSRPMKPVTIITLGAIAASTLPAAAQSFNVEFGVAGTTPDASYAGVGEAGVWNTFDSMPNFQRLILVGLDGNPIPVDIMNIGFDIIESSDIATTSGNDEALLDDCFTAFNEPIDGCFFMRFLQPGEYRVIMYGLAPDDVSLLSRLRIDQNTLDPVLVGGAWSGSHEEGVTYMAQRATVGSDGRLDIHSGLNNANIRSVCNAIQVIQLPPACPADLNKDGTLDFFDISAFLTAYNTNDPIADFTGDGRFDFFDVSAFLNLYGAGCP